MRKLLVALGAALILALDWAALHDITRGEPDPWAEYGMLAASAVLIAGWVIAARRRQRA